ncbi:MAG: FAD-dependent oxidoreductase [Clostridiales bacterium]|nr:FAD-dependent oxidoreductase [Clostridiales bacterium]
MKKSDSITSIGIVGGGIAGITAAIKLAKSGHFSVTVFEKEEEIGGLSSTYHWQDLACDRFYHVILPADLYLLQLIRDLGLESGLFWTKTMSGFYGDGHLVSLSSMRDFIRFPFLSLGQKFRLGLGILYANRIQTPYNLDSISARMWLTRLFGVGIYEKIWEPLLRSKFGDASDRVAASLVWATIKRLYGTRRSVEKQEVMGHVQGGYKTIFEAAGRMLHNLGAKILSGVRIEKVAIDRQNRKILVASASGRFQFDRLLMTSPCEEALQIIEDDKQNPYWQCLAQIEYLGVICLFLVLKRQLSPYYVINLLDRTLPFTGIVESTNVISPGNFGGRYLVYLPKYVGRDDPFINVSDREISSHFLEGLKQVFPDLNESDILHKRIFREKYVQPVLDIGFSKKQVGFRTPMPGVYLVNSSMITDSTLNSNAMVRLAQQVAEAIIRDSVIQTAD